MMTGPCITRMIRVAGRRGKDSHPTTFILNREVVCKHLGTWPQEACQGPQNPLGEPDLQPGSCMSVHLIAGLYTSTYEFFVLHPPGTSVWTIC